jgi:hypothetical protein
MFSYYLFNGFMDYCRVKYIMGVAGKPLSSPLRGGARVRVCGFIYKLISIYWIDKYYLLQIVSNTLLTYGTMCNICEKMDPLSIMEDGRFAEGER